MIYHTNYWSHFGVVVGAITSMVILLFIFKKLYPKFIHWVVSEKKYFRKYTPKSEYQILQEDLDRELNKVK